MTDMPTDDRAARLAEAKHVIEHHDLGDCRDLLVWLVAEVDRLAAALVMARGGHEDCRHSRMRYQAAAEEREARLLAAVSSHWNHDVSLWDEARAFCAGYCRTCRGDLSLSSVAAYRKARALLDPPAKPEGT